MADLFLDTHRYNAHTTAADALYAGVPLLTKAGSTMAARVAASFLTAIGVPQLVVDTGTERKGKWERGKGGGGEQG